MSLEDSIEELVERGPHDVAQRGRKRLFGSAPSSPALLRNTETENWVLRELNDDEKETLFFQSDPDVKLGVLDEQGRLQLKDDAELTHDEILSLKLLDAHTYSREKDGGHEKKGTNTAVITKVSSIAAFRAPPQWGELEAVLRGSWFHSYPCDDPIKPKSIRNIDVRVSLTFISAFAGLVLILGVDPISADFGALGGGGVKSAPFDPRRSFDPRTRKVRPPELAKLESRIRDLFVLAILSYVLQEYAFTGHKVRLRADTLSALSSRARTISSREIERYSRTRDMLRGVRPTTTVAVGKFLAAIDKIF